MPSSNEPINATKNLFKICLLTVLLLLIDSCNTEKVEVFNDQGGLKAVRYFGIENGDSVLVKEVTYYFNGNKEKEVHFKGGKLHGEFIRYWHNGHLKEQGEYENGIKQGHWELFFNNFNPAARGRYKDGKKHSHWEEFWENESRRSEGEYNMGKQTGTWLFWDRTGVLEQKNSCYKSNREGVFQTFHSNGNIREKYSCRSGQPFGEYYLYGPLENRIGWGQYNDRGEKTGLWKEINLNGEKSFACQYVNGLRQDTCQRWDPEGNLVVKGVYGSGTGTQALYDKKGSLLEEKHYEKGIRSGEQKVYYPDGKLKAVLEYEKNEPVKMIKLHENGEIAAKGKYSKGKKHGEWEHFDDRGRLKETVEYHLGEKHGKMKIYNPQTGEIRRVQEFHGNYPTRGSVPGLQGKVEISGD